MTISPGEINVANDDFFIVEKKNGIAWLIINRPKKHNAMNLDFFKGLKGHANHLANDASIRVVVIKAAGKNFTAGTDLAAAMSILGRGGPMIAKR